MDKMNTFINNYAKKNDLENTLMASFLEAKQNEIFEELINKLKLPYEELCKYTSTLEECSSEYNNCKHCKGLVACKNKIEGHAYLPRVHNGKLEFGYTPCKYKEKLEEENKYLKNVYSIDIPKEMKDLIKECKQIEKEIQFSVFKSQEIEEMIELYKKATVMNCNLIELQIKLFSKPNNFNSEKVDKIPYRAGDKLFGFHDFYKRAILSGKNTCIRRENVVN